MQDNLQIFLCKIIKVHLESHCNREAYKVTAIFNSGNKENYRENTFQAKVIRVQVPKLLWTKKVFGILLDEIKIIILLCLN